MFGRHLKDACGSASVAINWEKRGISGLVIGASQNRAQDIEARRVVIDCGL
jgi:hypothetical protein